MLGLPLALLLVAPVASRAQPNSPFQLPDGCALPFADIEADHEIDQQCGPDGDPTQSPAPPERVAAQNRAKNNFCATGDPALTTLLTFNRLEKAAEASGVEFGDRETLPADRSLLQGLYTTSEGAKVGEGSVVVFVGFVVKAKTETGGESVNCGVKGEEPNDFHIELSDSRRPSNRCNVIVAEMSPHFRPEGWTTDALNQLRKPVRVTGQLFFDASHKACKNGKPLPQQPVRNSLWEIHPVYSIDVCAHSSLSACRFNERRGLDGSDGSVSSLVPLPPAYTGEVGGGAPDPGVSCADPQGRERARATLFMERRGGAAMAVRDTVRRKLTYEDFLLFPEDGQQHEILDGEHYVMPAPSFGHQGISGNLHVPLALFVRQHRLGFVRYAPLDVLLSPHDIVEPDLLFISNERAGIIQEAYVKGAPDLMVEILSGSTRRKDETLKRDLYERSGVREYWIVDPRARRVKVFRLSGRRFLAPEELSATGSDLLTTPLLPGLELPVAEIFE